MARLLLNDRSSFEFGGSREESANPNRSDHLLWHWASLRPASNYYAQTSACEYRYRLRESEWKVRSLSPCIYRAFGLPVPPLDNVRMVFLGTLTRIDYESPKWSKRRPGRRKVRGYWHRSTGRPFVLSNPDGNVLVIFDPSGGLRVTADGIKG